MPRETTRQTTQALTAPAQLRTDRHAHNLARRPRGDYRSMTPTDAQQQQLRQAGDEALPFVALHAAGITFPAAVVSEHELNRYVIERVHEHGRLVGVRLLEPEPPVTSSAPRWRTSHR